MRTTQLVIGMLLLLTMFILSGINKVLNFHSTVDSLTLKSPHWPLKKLSIVFVILIEIICPIVIMYSMFNPQIKTLSNLSLLSLIFFVVIVTCIYHPLNLQKKYMQNIPFFSNLSLLGGLIILHSCTVSNS